MEFEEPSPAAWGAMLQQQKQYAKEHAASVEALLRSQKRATDPARAGEDGTGGDSRKRRRGEPDAEEDTESDIAEKQFQIQKAELASKMAQNERAQTIRSREQAAEVARREAALLALAWTPAKLKKLAVGTVVWARYRKFPFWPGVIDQNDEPLQPDYPRRIAVYFFGDETVEKITNFEANLRLFRYAGFSSWMSHNFRVITHFSRFVDIVCYFVFAEYGHIIFHFMKYKTLTR